MVVGTLKSIVGYRDLAREVRRRESGIERMQVGLLGAKDLAQSPWWLNHHTKKT